mgnify:CR=1 FL=1
MKAVVLAAGKGTRLKPLTNTKPKHLIPVGGKPILEHVLLTLKKVGIHEIYIIVGYKAEMIKDKFSDGSNLGLKIEYIVQSKLLGTADAIKTAQPYVNENFLVVYGDLLFTPKAIVNILRAHKQSKPSVTMAVTPVANPERYGVVKLEEGWVIDLVEKPPRGRAPSNFVNAGIYVFSEEIFEKIAKTKPSPRGELEVTDSLKLLMSEGRKVLAEEIPRNEWIDTGYPWNLLEANEWILKHMESSVKGNIEDGAVLTGRIIIEEGAHIRSGAYIEGPVYIGRNADVGPNCYVRPYTSIGNEVRIGNACEIKNSIIMDETHIGHLSYVGDSIIGENCNFGAGTKIANLRFDKKTVKMKIKGRRVDSGRRKLGVVFGDNVSTGIGALFMPGVKVGNDCWIDAGAVVREDVPPKTFLRLRQNLEQNDLRS